MTEEPRILRHVVVRGRVQGVGFRAFVAHPAVQRGLEGWVRNRRGGSVEAVFGGLQKTVDGMIGVCKVGPLSAKVDAVDVRDANEDDLMPRRAGEAFSCLPTL